MTDAARTIGTRGYDPTAVRDSIVAEHRSAEIEAVIEATRPEAPLRAGRLFEHYALAFIALASRATPRTVLVSTAAYRRLEDSGLLAFLRERYPGLTVEAPSKAVRGCHPDMVVMDELADFPEQS